MAKHFLQQGMRVHSFLVPSCRPTAPDGISNYTIQRLTRQRMFLPWPQPQTAGKDNRPSWFASSRCAVGRPHRGHWCWSRPVSPAWRCGGDSWPCCFSSCGSSSQRPPWWAHRPPSTAVWPPEGSRAKRYKTGVTFWWVKYLCVGEDDRSVMEGFYAEGILPLMVSNLCYQLFNGIIIFLFPQSSFLIGL